jgi:phage tail-like protein
MLDVNNTRYHLLLGHADWSRSQVEANRPRKWEYDASRQGIRLQAEVFTLAQQVTATVLEPEQRRDSARDLYGHWYWIDEAGNGIWARWARATQAEKIFPPAAEDCTATTPSGAFATAVVETLPLESLAGLAVTPEGYLVVGSPTTGSLLVFDLYAFDSGYLRISLSRTAEGAMAAPFALEVLADGGLLVLDRLHQAIWRFDRYLRPVPLAQRERGELKLFQPKTTVPNYQVVTLPTAPIALDSETVNPVAIAPLPDGSFWLLAQPEEGASRVWLYDSEGIVISLSDTDFLELITANLVETDADDLDLGLIRGYDLSYLPNSASQAATPIGTIWIADVNGQQAYALDLLSLDPFTLRIQRQYYPLRKFENVSLITAVEAGEIYYHQTGDRKVPIKALPRQRYEPEATMIFPISPEGLDDGFDGREPNCLWHRLCLDACIPPETEIRLEVRAAEQTEDLKWAAWQLQPPLYLRPSPEIPYSTLWSPDELTDAHTGTWELLLQQVQGRYLQIRLTLIGNGRSTPFIRALRAHYPRFSYLKEYLPDVYQQDAASASFLDRFLANPEGIFTTLEGLIAQVQTLFDVRTVPPDAVDWFASWVGLALEPAWSDYQRRLLIAHAPYFFQRRGTFVGLSRAILLTLYPEELGACLFQDDLEAIAKRYPKINQVRIVERFRTRSQPGVAFGDPTDLTLTTSEGIRADAKARAHQFIVVVPTDLSEDKKNLLARLLDLEKPAHTAYSIKQYWALFRVGEIRLGIDTVLGQGGQFETFRLGQSALAEAALGEAFPYTLTTRTVLAQ